MKSQVSYTDAEVITDLVAFGVRPGRHRDDREPNSQGTSQVISPQTQAALARERRDSLLAEAEASRRARRSRRVVLHDGPEAEASRRTRRSRRVVLRDGSAVLIGQVHRADALLLADGFRRLSARSRRMRFLTRKDELSAAELRYLTDLDHHNHEALGAVSHADGRGVGVARYVRDTDDPQAAEIAITIVDDWQGRGLGTELLAQLSSRARRAGIRRFTALVSAENAAMAGLLRNVSARLVHRVPGAVEYEIVLAASEKPPARSHSGSPLAPLPG